MCVRPITLQHVEYCRSVVGHASSERVVRLFGELGHLGLVHRGVTEPAEPAEAEYQVEASDDRHRHGPTQVVQNQVRRQCSENLSTQLDGLRQFTAIVVKLYQAGCSIELEIQIPTLLASFHCATSGHQGFFEIARLPIVPGQERPDTSLPALVVQALRDAFSLSQVLEQLAVLTQLEQYPPQLETNVDGRLEGRAVIGQRSQKVQCLLERDASVVERRASRRLESRLVQIIDSLVPHITPDCVMGEPLDLLAKAILVEPLECLDDARVQRPPTVLQQSPVGHLVGQRVLEGVLQIGKQRSLAQELCHLELR